MIQKKLDDSLAKIQEERKNRTSSGKISPSQMGYCFRRQYWHRKGEPVTNPPDARLLRVFKCGNLFEDKDSSLYMLLEKRCKMNWFKG